MTQKKPVLFGRHDPNQLLKSKYRGWRHHIIHGWHHGSGFGNGDPWKIYNNTYLFFENVGKKGAGTAAKGPRATGIPHEVYNNMFIQFSDYWVTRGGRIDDGLEIHDGNLYYRAVDNPGEQRFFHQIWTTEATYSDFSSLIEFKDSGLIEATRSYYSPGWEQSGVEINPELNANYIPQNHQEAWLGGVDLSHTAWPGTQSLAGAPYRGAVIPQ